MTSNKSNALIVVSLVAFSALMIGLVQAQATGGSGTTKGSIKVCKVIADDNGNIIDGSAFTGSVFNINGFTPSPVTSEGAPAGVLPTSTFDTGLSFNAKILSGSSSNDAECITYSNLNLGNYYYREESITGSGWQAPLYNDQHTMSVSTLADFLPYSGQLFDSNSGNDGSRNTNSDGHIVITSTVPNRTLVILNRRVANTCQTFETRSYGYWKNHSENWRLPQTLGSESVTTTSQVQSIFNNYSQSSLTKLKAQLLAMKFTIAYFVSGQAIVPGESISINDLANAADTLLTSGSYTSGQLDAMRQRVETVNLAHAITSCPSTPDVGYLKVIKQVVNDDGGTKQPANFTLHVKQSDADVLGSPSAGSSVGVIYVLEPGSYKLSENIVSGYDGTISGDCSSDGVVSVGANQTKICTITNNDQEAPKECKLEITKSADKSSITPGEEVTFTLNFKNIGDADCTGGGVKIKDVVDSKLIYVSSTNSSNVTPGYGSLPLYNSTNRTLYWNANTLNPGETGWVEWKGRVKQDLACGNFEVKNTGYITAKEYSNFAVWVPSNEVVVNGNNSCSANLVVIKHVINDNDGTLSAPDFTMNVTATNPSQTSFAGSEVGTVVTVTAGAYSVDEVTQSGYIKNLSSDCVGNIATGETKTCTIVNDDQAPTTASLIVIKHVINDDGGTKSAGDFTINVTADSPVPASFSGSEVGTAVIVNPGAYSVDEIEDIGYTKSLSSDCSGTIIAGDIKTCTITNDDKPVPPGKVIVIKDVINDNGGTAIASDFTMNVTATNPSQTSFPGSGVGVEVTVTPGAYSVDESSSLGYTKTLGVDCVGTVSSGETKTCTITNDDVEVPEASLIVKKVVINDNGGIATASAFTIHVKQTSADIAGSPQPGSFVGTAYTLTPGDYVVSESDIPSGYTMESISGDCNSAGEVALVNGDVKTCVVTNNDNPAEVIPPVLIVKKEVINDNGGVATASDFSIYVKQAGTNVAGSPQAGSSTGTSYTLVPGSYSVGEVSVITGYSLQNVGGDCDSTGAITLASGDVKTCIITNNDNPSDILPPLLIVKKVVINDNGRSRQPGDFTMKVTGAGSFEQTFPGSTSGTNVNVPIGNYSVDEVDKFDYTKTLSADCSGTIAAGETKTCTITNDDPTPPPVCTSNCGGGGGGGGPDCSRDPYKINPDSVAITTSAVSGNKVDLGVTYGAGITGLVLSNTNSFSPQSSVPLSSTVSWDLASGSGERTVYARFVNQWSCQVEKSIVVTGSNTPPPPQVLGEQCINMNAEIEKSKADSATQTKYAGQIVLQCNNNKIAWYIDPVTKNKYFLPSQTITGILSKFAVGMSNSDLAKIPVGVVATTGVDTDGDGLANTLELALGTNINSKDTDSDGFADDLEVKTGYNPTGAGAAAYDLTFAKQQVGKVLLQTGGNGELWFVNPVDQKRYFMPSAESSSVVAGVGACISDVDLNKLPVGLAVNGVALRGTSTCYPPVPLVLGESDSLPRTGIPAEWPLALPLLAMGFIALKDIGREWIKSSLLQ